MKIKQFNEHGLSSFRYFLEDNQTIEPKGISMNEELTNDSRFEVSELLNKEFLSLFDFAKYLNQLNGNLHLTRFPCEQWSWLACSFFNVVCKKESDKWIMRSINRYLYEKNYRDSVQHLVAVPYNAYRLHGEYSKALLTSKSHVFPYILKEVAGRQEVFHNKGIVECIYKIFFDEKANKIKRNAADKEGPGTIRRFMQIMKQLDVNYDLFGMNGQQIMALLPPEFDKWKK